jgi:alanine racemase
MSPASSSPPHRPAWIEVDLRRLRNNYEIIFQDKPPGLRVLAVVKDEAYGHGLVPVARAAIECGATFLGVSNLDEAMTLREQDVSTPILVFGERTAEELPWCLAYNLTCSASDVRLTVELARLAARRGVICPVHVKIDTGMSRYGVRWTEAKPLLQSIQNAPSLRLDGIFSHFAMSDELDKSFALTQLARYQSVVDEIPKAGETAFIRHLCNSGGFLDIPAAHGDMVRLGILPLGVYPSSVCRRIPGIMPVMTVKTRIAVVRNIQASDTVGYGMRYKAESPRRIGVLPIGYGDGYPRVRNLGHVLVDGLRAPIVGGCAMDAFMVDITDIPSAQPGAEVVLMGQQGEETITVQELAKWKGTVSYEVLASWRSRLPRIYINS